MPDYIQIIASGSIKDLSGTPLANGEFSIVATDGDDNEIPVRVGASAAQALEQPVKWVVTNGALPESGVQVPNPATSDPSPVYYRIKIKDIAQNRTTVYRKVQVVDRGDSKWDFATMKTGLSVSSAVVTYITGPEGKSAYKIAEDNGFTGSEGAWLLSLRGDDGDVSSQQLLKQLSPLASFYPMAQLGASTVPDTAAVANTVLFPNVPTTAEKYITGLSIYLGSPSDSNTPAVGAPVKIVWGSLSGNAFTLGGVIDLAAKNNGINTYTAGVDFNAVKVPAGTIIGVWCAADSQIWYATNSGVALRWIQNVTSIGDIGTTYNSAINGTRCPYMVIELTSTTTALTVPTPDQLDTMIAEGADAAASAVRAPLLNYYPTAKRGNDLATRQNHLTSSNTTSLIINAAGGAVDEDLVSFSMLLGDPANPSTTPTAGSTQTIFVCQKTGTIAFTVTDIITVPAKGNGLNTWTVGVDFDPRIIPANSYFGYNSDNVNNPVFYGGGGPTSFAPGTAVLSVGQAISVPTNGGNGYLSVTTRPRTTALTVPTPDQLVLQATRNKNANHALMYETQFPGTATPASWVLGAGWTVSDGLVSPAAPTTYGVFSQLQQPYNAEQRTDRIQFEILAADAIVAVGARNGAQTSDPAFGTLIRVDATAQTLAITNRYIAGADPGDNTSVAIPFPVSAGKRYWLSIVSNKQEITAVLTDPVSAAQVSVHVGNNATDTGARPLYGLMWDWPTAVCPAGQYKIHDWRILANEYKPHLYIEGDSITYGLGVPRAVRWAELLANAAGSSSVISGRSGAYSSNTVLAVNTEVATLLPDYVVILIGTNNASNGSAQIAPFTDQINTIVSIAKQYAQKVVLGTLPCRTAATDNSGFNAAILAAGADAVLRFDLATSVGNDGVTQDATLFQGDNLHPNAAGHTAMFARVAADAPWLLD